MFTATAIHIHFREKAVRFTEYSGPHGEFTQAEILLPHTKLGGIPN